MTGPQAEAGKAKDSEKATRAKEQLTQAVRPAISGLHQALGDLALADRLALLGGPNLQAAQKSQVALGLQRSCGNKWMQRAIAESVSGPSETPALGEKEGAREPVRGGDITITPRPGLAGTIARWPIDDDAERERVLTQAEGSVARAQALIDRAVAALQGATPDHGAARTALNAVETIFEQMRDLDLPRSTLDWVGLASRELRRAESLLFELSSLAEGIPSILGSAVHVARGYRRIFGRPRVWDRRVVQSLGVARRMAIQAVRQRSPNFAPAVASINQAKRHIATVPTETPEQVDAVLHLTRLTEGALDEIRMFSSDAATRNQYAIDLVLTGGAHTGIAETDLGALRRVHQGVVGGMSHEDAEAAVEAEEARETEAAEAEAEAAEAAGE